MLYHQCLKQYLANVGSVQFCSVTQSCLTLCDPMNHSTPGLPVHHQLLESTQTHVHRVSDAIQPSHPLSSPSPPALNLSQHQGLVKWVSSPHCKCGYSIHIFWMNEPNQLINKWYLLFIPWVRTLQLTGLLPVLPMEFYLFDRKQQNSIR